MLHIRNLEEIGYFELKASSLIQMYEQHDTNFLAATKKWLEQLELILLKNRLTIASKISSLRGNIITSERGKIPNSMTFNKKISKHKISEIVAEQSIHSALESVNDSLKEEKARIRNAEARIYELVILAREINLIPIEFPKSDNNIMLQEIWENIKLENNSTNHQVIRGKAIAVQTLVGKIDALILFERIVNFE